MRLSDITYPLPSRPTTIKLLYFPHFSIFFLFKKSKRLQKKSKLCPQKGKQASLKSKSFCAMLRKKRLKCGRIPAHLFLACHQKSNIFKCKQFCCAKPMCACLFMGCARDPTTPRRSIKFAASSAHSPVNSLPLKQYGLVRLASQAVPSPVSIGLSNTAARLLKVLL